MSSRQAIRNGDELLTVRWHGSSELGFSILMVSVSLLQGLIARGDHRGSLVEKDIKPPRIHIDEQVTGFERSVPRLDDFHTWHGATSHMQIVGRRARPRSLFQPTVSKPSSNGVQSSVLQLDHLECLNCSKIYGFNLEEFDRWFDHIRFCGV